MIYHISDSGESQPPVTTHCTKSTSQNTLVNSILFSTWKQSYEDMGLAKSLSWVIEPKSRWTESKSKICILSPPSIKELILLSVQEW